MSTLTKTGDLVDPAWVASTVGGRASRAWFLLAHLLGYPKVRVYHASWAERGALPDTPVAR